MKWSQSILFFLTLFTFSTAIALPASFESWTDATKELFKRKGGGGGGGRGGGSSGGSSSSGGRTGSSGSSTSSGGTRTPGSVPGVRGYGSGSSYYAGGATSAYRSGSPRGGVTPYLVGGAALGVFPGLWLASAYAYSWPGYYGWRNYTTNQNETGPVDCWCAENAGCGCDNTNNNTELLSQVANNATIAHRLDNGTLYINGTLPEDAITSGAASLRQGLIENSGYWVVIAGVTYAVSFL